MIQGGSNDTQDFTDLEIRGSKVAEEPCNIPLDAIDPELSMAIAKGLSWSLERPFDQHQHFGEPLPKGFQSRQLFCCGHAIRQKAIDLEFSQPEFRGLDRRAPCQGLTNEGCVSDLKGNPCGGPVPTVA